MHGYSIQDPDIKLAVCSILKRNFAEAVAFTLAARAVSRPQMDEVRKVKAVEEKEWLLNKLKEILEQVLRENGQKVNLNSSIVERVVISNETVGHHGTDQDRSHQQDDEP